MSANVNLCRGSIGASLGDAAAGPEWAMDAAPALGRLDLSASFTPRHPFGAGRHRLRGRWVAGLVIVQSSRYAESFGVGARKLRAAGLVVSRLTLHAADAGALLPQRNVAPAPC